MVALNDALELDGPRGRVDVTKRELDLASPDEVVVPGEEEALGDGPGAQEGRGTNDADTLTEGGVGLDSERDLVRHGIRDAELASDRMGDFVASSARAFLIRKRTSSEAWPPPSKDADGEFW